MYLFRKLLFFCSFFFCLYLQAQEEIYHQVEIQLSNAQEFEALQHSGIALDCGGHAHSDATKEPHTNAMNYHVIVSQSELQLLQSQSFKTQLLQPNLAQFYAQRIAADPLKSVKDFKLQKNADWGLGGEKPFYEIPENFELGSMGGYLTYEELLGHLDNMRELYPQLVSTKQAISSEISTYENRPVYWLKISDFPTLDETHEPEVLYTALHHAREPMSAMQLIYFMYYLLENYETNPEIQDLVNHRELYFIPCINPDGYIYNQLTNPEGGGLWRKNRKIHPDGNAGVDLNRNYGYEWGYNESGSSSNTLSNLYRGEAPFSESETQLVKLFCEQHEFQIALNYHAYGSFLIYPWGYETSAYTEDQDYFQQMCHQAGWHNNYIYGTVHETLSYTANGDSDDWMYGEQETKNKILALTPEVGNSGDGFWPSTSHIIPICQENVWSNFQYAYMVGNYAVATDASEKTLTETEGTLEIKLKRMGLKGDGNFSLQLQPLTSNFSITSPPIMVGNLQLLEIETVSFDYVLSPDILPQEAIQYQVLVNNGDFTVASEIITKWNDSFIAFEHPAEYLAGWTSEDWYRTNQTAYSGNYSLTDSPYVDYDNFDSTTIVLQHPIDLSEVAEAYLTFWAKWDIQPHRDFAQVLASKDEGANWTPLCGNFTQDGTRYQSEGNPIYDGKQMKWVKEEMDLVDFVGEFVLICFLLQTDGNTKADGFYWDELKVNYRTQPVFVDLKLQLEGAYNAEAGEMNSFLRDKNLLPLSQPFNDLPWNYEGEEQVQQTTFISANVVDWILVELRDEETQELVHQKAAWLLKDGTVMDVSGRLGVAFFGAELNKSYFILVRHRNHLDVLSSVAVTLEEGYDFSLAIDQVAGTNQLEEVAENVFALKAGDVNGNGVVSIDDFNLYYEQIANLNQYRMGDLSMDGLVSVKDYNTYRKHSAILGIPIVRYE